MSGSVPANTTEIETEAEKGLAIETTSAAATRTAPPGMIVIVATANETEIGTGTADASGRETASARETGTVIGVRIGSARGMNGAAKSAVTMAPGLTKTANATRIKTAVATGPASATTIGVPSVTAMLDAMITIDVIVHAISTGDVLAACLWLSA